MDPRVPFVILGTPVILFIISEKFFNNVATKWKLPIANIIYIGAHLILAWQIIPPTSSTDQFIISAGFVCFVPIILNCVPLFITTAVTSPLSYVFKAVKIDDSVVNILSIIILLISVFGFWYKIGASADKPKKTKADPGPSKPD